MFEMETGLVLAGIAAIIVTILLYVKVMPEANDGKLGSTAQKIHDFFHFKKLYLEVVLKFIYVLATVTTICTGIYFLSQANEKMLRTFEQIEIAVDNENPSSAVELCKKAEDQWIEFENSLTFFVNHSEISEIGVDIAAMRPLILNKEKAEFLSILEGVKIKMRHLTKMEKIH